MKSELKEIEEKELDPGFWLDNNVAKNLLKRKALISKQIQNYENLINNYNDNKELLEILDPDSEDRILLDADLQRLYDDAKVMETECLFSGEHDNAGCFIEINSGAGGTESDDWVQILARMYLRFCEKSGFKTEIIHELPGEEAGTKSISIKVEGSNGYGWLRTETGVHRLVRISPFNSAGKRMTSFASVWIYPELKDNIDILIEDKDIRIDTYRSSGAGGQHVNTTDSAVRITHIPTNLVVQCQSGRSQHKNKAEAYQMLRARLYELEIRNRNEEQQQQHDSKTQIGWGHQIRSYVLHPYQMIKDLRTDFSTGNVAEVLDGELKDFIYKSLAHKVTNKRKEI